MSRTLTIAALLCCVICLSGCTVCQNARRTLFWEPEKFPWKQDRFDSREMYRRWAHHAWSNEGFETAPCTNENYKWGFIEGFVEYVYAGGNGEPPAAPPREFWNAGWRTGKGKQAADQWFDGYRHGARVAHLGGYREEVVLRSAIASTGFRSSQEDSLFDGQPVIAPEQITPSVEQIEFGPNRAEALPAGDMPADTFQEEPPLDEEAEFDDPELEFAPAPNFEKIPRPSRDSLRDEIRLRTPASMHLSR